MEHARQSPAVNPIVAHLSAIKYYLSCWPDVSLGVGGVDRWMSRAGGAVQLLSLRQEGAL